MSIDLTKLFSAPWKRGEGDPYTVVGAGGSPILLSEWDNDDGIACLEFAALARNAFDVQMRRGWETYRKNDGRWYVAMKGIENGADRYFQLYHHFPNGWSDPFTALVETDAWYRETTEKPG